jgi:inosose dehydratase
MKLGFGMATWIPYGSYNYERFHVMLDELALAGYDGLESAQPFILNIWGRKPLEFKKLMDMHGLELSAAYAGIDFRTPEATKESADGARRLINFYSQTGCGHFLMDIRNEKDSQGYNLDHVMSTYTDKELENAGNVANELGKYAREHGMQLSFHTHWGTFFEFPGVFEKFWAATDPNLVSLCPDVGQILLSRQDPVEYVRNNINRITHYIHFKDIAIKSRPKGDLWPGYNVPNNDGGYGVDSAGRFIETGRGDVDFKSITKILRDGGFDGWITTDLDLTANNPMLSAIACKDYVNKALGIIGDRDKKQG